MLGHLWSIRARTTVAATIALGPLEQRAGQVAAMARSGTLRDPLSFPDQPGALVQVVDAKDRVLAASNALQGRAPIGRVDDPRGGLLSAWTERLTSDDEA